MLQPVLVTKLHIPQARTTLVSRPRLFERLNEGLVARLTTVMSPAGSGKSTLISEWVRAQPYPTAWLSLDEMDSDPPRFMLHLVAALQTIHPDITHQIKAALVSGNTQPLETLFSAIINDLAAEDDLILVLDDYHVIESTEIDRGLAFFVNHLPSTVHFIIASRSKPSLPLGRLRASGELTEIRASDLRFSVKEVRHFLETNTEVAFNTDHIISIEQRTEGWAAGLQLAALALQHATNIDDFVQTFTGSHRYVMDYLTDEVLSRLAEDEHQFLLQTSILNEMCGDLCDVVTQRSDSQQLLERFAEMNLFIIALDDAQHWYRCHHLFATLLRHRLAKHPQGRQHKLHQLAAEWYEDHEMVDNAIHHYQAANSQASVVHLIKENGVINLQPGYLGRLQRWLNLLSSDMLQADGHLAALQAWIHYFGLQSDQVALWLEYAQRALDQSQAAPSESLTQTKWSIVALQSWLAYQQGEFSKAIQLATATLDHLPETVLMWRGMSYIFLGHALAGVGRTGDSFAAYEMSLQYLGIGNHIAITAIATAIYLTRFLRGQLNEAKSQLDQLLEATVNQAAVLSDTFPRLVRLAIMYEQNDLSSMQPEISELWNLLQYDASFTRVRLQYVSAKYYIALGDYEHAHHLLRQIEQDANSWTSNDEQARTLASVMRVYLQLGDTDGPIKWLQSIEIPKKDFSFLFMDVYLAIADILRFHQSPHTLQAGIEMLAALHEVCDDAKAEGTRLEVYCLQALLMAANGDAVAALTPLRQALAFSAAQGYVRTFVDFGQPMAHLLYDAAARNIHAEYAGFLLTQFPSDPVQSPSSHNQHALIEPLSERELEILELLAQGLPNQAIANQLFLALNTVKVHNRNIYMKLSAKNRTEAVAIGRQLGIVD